MKMWNRFKQKSAGVIKIADSDIRKGYSFSEYLFGGLDLSIIFCVGFTEEGSGSSSHKLSSKEKNDYELIMSLLSPGFQYYSKNKNIDLYGYGADTRFPNADGETWNNKISNFFPCSGDLEISRTDLKDVLKDYRKTLGHCQLCSPAVFAPCLEFIIPRIEANLEKNPDNYTTVVFLANESDKGMAKTLDWMVKASNLPLSILILGIGDADFSEFGIFTKDTRKLIGSNLEHIKRDFVNFMKFDGKAVRKNPAQFVEKIFSALPTQIIEYYEMVDRNPGENILDQILSRG